MTTFVEESESRGGGKRELTLCLLTCLPCQVNAYFAIKNTLYL